MPHPTAEPGSGVKETELHEVDGVPVYARKDQQGRPRAVDAIDQDETKIRAIADRLQRRGYGVMRQRNPRGQGSLHVEGRVGRHRGAARRSPHANIPADQGDASSIPDPLA